MPEKNISSEPAKQSKSTLKVIILVIVGVFVLGGVAFGSWYSYEKYIKTPSLTQLFAESIHNIEQANTYELKYKMRLELGEVEDATSTTQAGIGTFSEMLDDDEEQVVDLTGKGFIDQADSENIKSEFDILLVGPESVGNLEMEFKFINKSLYLQLLEIPAIIDMFMDSNQLTNSWIKIDRSAVEDSLDADIFDNENEDSKKLLELTKTLFVQESVIEEIKECTSEQIEKEKVINCQFKIKGSGIRDLVRQITEPTAEYVAPGVTAEDDDSLTGALGLLDLDDDEALEEFYENIEKLTFDVTFPKTKRDSINLKILYNGEETQLKSLVFELILDSSVEARELKVPEESINIQEIISQIMVSMMGDLTMEHDSSAALIDDDEFSASSLSDYVITDFSFSEDNLELDSDNDGLTDLDEVSLYQTDPGNPDTDGDGYSDGEEVENGYDPKN